MEQLRALLTWNAKVSDPFFLALVLSAMVLLTMVLIMSPRLYLPFLLITAPFPKLFTIASYSDGTQGNSLNGNPGFSVVDMVLVAGIVALLFRRWRRIKAPGFHRFNGAMGIWAASIVLSVAVGLIIWSGTYRPINSIYALRYLLTLASFGLGAQYGQYDCSEHSLQRFLRVLAYTGNVTIFLGLFYYFEFGSSAGGARGVLLFSGTGSLVFRSYLWFFDYSIDMGYFAATIAVLNVILLSDRRLIGLRLLCTAGLFGCIASILLIGERVNVLVVSCMIGYFIWETSSIRHRSVRVTVIFQTACILAVVLAFAATMTVVAPEFISQKFENSVGQDTLHQEEGRETMMSAGVPEWLAESVSSLPIGDFALRLSLNVAGIWYFVNHPEGVGFWGQLGAAGFWSHHEIVMIAMEQGVLGLAALVFFLVSLKRLLWSGRDLPGAAGQLGVLLRASSAGLFVAMIMANTVLLDMKYALVYWTLVGIWSVIPRSVRPMNTVIAMSAPGQRIAARV